MLRGARDADGPGADQTPALRPRVKAFAAAAVALAIGLAPAPATAQQVGITPESLSTLPTP